MSIKIKSAEQIELLRQSGHILAVCLEELKAYTRPGLSTAQIAKHAAGLISKLGAEPAFLGYQGFMDVICISINDEVVHGIPGTRVIAAGDLVSLDLGVRYRGLITDACVSVVAGGKPTPDQQLLLEATQEALALGIDQARAGNRVGDISSAVGQRLSQDKLGIVEVLSGHGVGLNLHEDPEIPNFGLPNTGPKLKAGMTIAIEPIATLGSPEVFVAGDGWTYKTSDGSLAGEIEHTILITSAGPEVLTQLSI